MYRSSVEYLLQVVVEKINAATEVEEIEALLGDVMLTQIFMSRLMPDPSLIHIVAHHYFQLDQRKGISIEQRISEFVERLTYPPKLFSDLSPPQPGKKFQRPPLSILRALTNLKMALEAVNRLLNEAEKQPFPREEMDFFMKLKDALEEQINKLRTRYSTEGPEVG
jgi:hypothetical protein